MIPTPTPSSNEALLRVHAFSINRADIHQRRSTYPPPAGVTATLGVEAAGVIVAVGASFSSFAVGSRVMSLVAGGAYAEFVLVTDGMCMAVPPQFDMIQAAAVPEAFLTAYQLLRHIGRVRRDEAVPIHAAASGVGTALIQLTRLFGAVPIATAGSDSKLRYCRTLGAAFTVNYKATASWAAELQDRLRGTAHQSGVDLILDPVGASHFADNIAVAAMDARWIVYATLSGADVTVNLSTALMRKRLCIMGTTLRNRSESYKRELVIAFTADCAAPLADGSVRPIIDTVFAFEHVAKAHALMERNSTTGKIVVVVIPSPNQ